MRAKMEWKKGPFVRVVNFSTPFLRAWKKWNFSPEKCAKQYLALLKIDWQIDWRSRPSTRDKFFENYNNITWYSGQKIKILSARKNGVEKGPIRTCGEFFHSIFARIKINKFFCWKNAPKNIWWTQWFFLDPAENQGLRPGLPTSIRI